jgi:putative ABC transport system permease protein
MPLKSIGLRLRALFSKADREFDEEIRFHLDRETERHVAAGRTPDEGRRLALKAFGGVEATKELRRDGWGVRWLDDTLRDARYAIRSLARNPVLACTAILTLALGIGASTAIFSALNAVVLRPLPFPQPDRLVMVWEENREKAWYQQVAAPANVLDWRDGVPAFADVAAYEEFDDTVTLTGMGEPRLLSKAVVMGNLFAVLGVGAQQGRTLTDQETWRTSRRVAVISDRLWRTDLGTDPGTVGRNIILDGQPTEVVGIMPPSFGFPSRDVDVWMPFAWDPAQRTAVSFRRAHWARVVARLAPGVTHDDARPQLDAVMARLQQEYPETNTGAGAGLTPLHAFLTRESRGPIAILMAAVALVLLMACANVGNLLLVRAAGRDREAALRLSLGAGRPRLVRQALTESLVLSAIGGLAGLGLGWLGTRAFDLLRPSTLVHLGDVRLDWRVLVYVVAASTLSGIIFGAAPALWSGRRRPAEVLKDTGRGSTSHRASQWASGLVIVEVATALLLASGAGLLIRSFVALQQVDPGFDAEGVLVVALNPRGERYDTDEKIRLFYRELLTRARALPGVQDASGVTELPLTGNGWTSDFTVAGRSPDDYGVEVSHREVMPDYFRTMRVPVIRGREFTAQDTAGGLPVVLINETLARRYFPDDDAIGQQVAFTRTPTDTSSWKTIVGIVADERQTSLGNEAPAQFTAPFEQDPSGSVQLVLRVDGSPAALAPDVRTMVARIDSDLPITEMRTMNDVRAASLERERFLLALLLMFAGVGFLLASIGVYGVMAQFARGRTREMGIRLALGASARDVRRLVLVRGLRLASIGLAIGLVTALFATEALRAFLFDVEPTDPLTFTTVAALLLATAMLATWLPALRASHTDPAATMREE